MPAPTDSSGSLKYWFNGLPFSGIEKSGNDNGSIKFWFNGLPSGFIFPTVSSNIKTVNTLARASIKTINGLSLASIKKRNGLE